MIGAEINGTNWIFRYNSQNQMYYSKIADEYDCVIDERFYIYDGLNCIAETDTDGEILREYIRIGNVGGIVAEIRHNDTTCAPGYESGTFYYHYNHRGDVITVSSHNGGIVFKADYDAYGKPTRIDSGSFEPRYTFSTKRYFKELGLYYYGYRWYLPELGRWTIKDPIGLKGGLNMYKFCINNSIIFIDLFGLKVGDWWDLLGNHGRADHLAHVIMQERGGHNDFSDAMRHAEWSKRTAEQTNPFTAWYAGLGHELEGFWDNVIKEDMSAKDYLSEMAMDLHNNAEGRNAKHQKRDINKDNLVTNPDAGPKNGCSGVGYL